MTAADRLVLALDGSTNVCATALLGLNATAGWQVLASRAEIDSRGQAKLLLPMVDDMLVQGGFSPSDLAAIVVGTGPGTFTGVRIAVATARALSLALALPIAGISTLSALAAGAAGPLAAGTSVSCEGEAAVEGQGVRLLVPVVDARRGQVFYGLYESDGRAAPGGRRESGPQAPRQRWVRTAPFAVCDRAALAGIVREWGNETLLVLGEEPGLVGDLPANAVFQTRSVGADTLVVGQDLLVEPGESPQGDRLRPWLTGVLSQGGPAVPEAVKPIYVRSPDADIHITKMKDPWADSPGNAAATPDGSGR